MIPFNEDFEDLLLAMADADVEFLVVGGWAMTLHGHSRSTDGIWHWSDLTNLRPLSSLWSWWAK